MKSPLATKEILSPNYNARKASVRKFTIHHTANLASAEAVAKSFLPKSRNASSNYIIGGDGKIVLGVPEEYRAWTSSNADNDHQAITVEVCNSTKGPEWKVSDAALEATINLGVDICRRYGLPGFTWTGNKNGTLTIHKMFSATVCPGPYLESKMPYIAAEIKKRLNTQKEGDDMLYKVQVGAFSVKENAEKLLAELKAKGYNGFIVTVDDGKPATTAPATPAIAVGSAVKIKSGAKDYNGSKLSDFVYAREYKVKEIKGDRVVITYGGTVVAAIKLSDLILV